MDNSSKYNSEKNAEAYEAQKTQQVEEDNLDFGEVEVEEVDFERHVTEQVKVLFSDALRELGYYGASHELAGAHILLRDKDSKNTIEIGMNLDNGEYLLRLVTERQRQPRIENQPTRLVWGNPND